MAYETSITNETDGEGLIATVEVVMTSDIVTISLDDSLYKVQNIFVREGFHHLLVVDEDEVVGVLSDRDVLSALSPYLNTPSEKRRDEQTLQRRAHHVMSRQLVTVTRTTPIAQAASLLLKHNVGCLPVVASAGPIRTCAGSHLRLVPSGRILEGIVTWRDIMAYYLGFDLS